MTVNELTKRLFEIEDKSLPIYIDCRFCGKSLEFKVQYIQKESNMPHTGKIVREWERESRILRMTSDETILTYLAKGNTKEQVCVILNVSRYRLNNRLDTMRERYNAKTLIELVAIAIRGRII
jgi:DNA-binding CsgD family transcriptional regulator